MLERLKQALAPGLARPARTVALPGMRRGLAAQLGTVGRLLLAERFEAPPALAAVHVPLGGIADLADALRTGLLLAVVMEVDGHATARTALIGADAVEGAGVRLAFFPFERPAPGSAFLVACEGATDPDLTPSQRKAVVRELSSRPPIRIACNDGVPGFTSVRLPLGVPGRMWPVAGCTAAAEAAPPPPAHDPRLAYALDAVWMENGDAMVRGWMHAYAADLPALHVRGPDGAWLPVRERSARPDLLPHYPMVPDGAKDCGFSVLVPGAGTGPASFKATLGTGEEVRVGIDLPRRGPSAEDEAARKAQEAAWSGFIREVNDRTLVLLEIGSRLVGPDAESWRPTFAGASRYIGFDVHPAPGVDIVGDAHRLSDHVGHASVEALFSVAVLEHIAMPWLLAPEINRVLKPGGLTYHITVQTWPVHEQPNDFWRYTDESLKLLFGPMNGFEVVAAGLCQRMRMYPEDRTANDPGTGFFPGYGNAWILARKVAEVPDHATPGPDTAALAELSRRYPRHADKG